MAYKILFCFAAFMIIGTKGGVVTAQGGLVAAPLPYAVAPYASSYTAHVAHHSVATPVAAAPYAAPYLAAQVPIASAAGFVAAAPVLPPQAIVQPYTAYGSAAYVAGR